MKNISSNFIYLAVFQSYNFIVPIIIYPFLIKVLDLAIWSEILVAQSVSASLGVLINLGLDRVGVKKIISSVDKKQRVLFANEVLFTRILVSGLIFILFGVYTLFFVENKLLYLIFFGANFNLIFFPNWYFEATYSLKTPVLINVSIRLLFVATIFVLIDKPEDYLIYPIMIAIGTLLGSLLGLGLLIKGGVGLSPPSLKAIWLQIKEGSYLLVPDVLAIARGKGSILILAMFFNPLALTLFDLIQKTNALINQVTLFVNASIFPQVCKDNKLKKHFKYLYATVFFAGCYFLVMLFYGELIFGFFGISFYSKQGAIYLYSSPIVLAGSLFIARNILLANSKLKALLYDSYISNIIFVCGCILLAKTNSFNFNTFSALLLITYIVELVYRFSIAKPLLKK